MWWIILYVLVGFSTWILTTVLALKQENYPDSYDYFGACAAGAVCGAFWPVSLTGLLVLAIAKGIVWLSEDYNREELIVFLKERSEKWKENENTN